MSEKNPLSRRALLAGAAGSPLASLLARGRNIPIGLELYSVRDRLKEDPTGTVRAVANLGYEDVEFFAPYFDWTLDKAREMRGVLDKSGLRCLSTHNGAASFNGDGLEHAVELNKALGAKYIVWASAGRPNGTDGWKKVAETLTRTSEQLKPAGLKTGYHNHKLEFEPVDGKRPIEIIAENTPKDVMLQLDVGTCIEAGSDPVAWIEANPGRIRSLHLKDWSPEPDKGYKVLLGEGVAPWKKIFDAAESVGGVEFYLIEQEGSAYPSMETAEKCLAAFKRLHG